MPLTPSNDIELTGKIKVRQMCGHLREKYDWAFSGHRPPDHQMLVDINDLRWMIECIERLNK